MGTSARGGCAKARVMSEALRSDATNSQGWTIVIKTGGPRDAPRPAGGLLGRDFPTNGLGGTNVRNVLSKLRVSLPHQAWLNRPAPPAALCLCLSAFSSSPIDPCPVSELTASTQSRDESSVTNCDYSAH